MNGHVTRATLAGLLFAAGCDGGGGPAPEAPPLPGGETTFDDRTSSAFENPAPNLDRQALERHLDGDRAFEAQFVSAPAEVNPGLGPLYNNTACAGCHLRDGRGLPVVGRDARGSQLLVRISLPTGEPAVPGGPVPVPGLGTQIQDHAVFGHVPEATVTVSWVETPGVFPADGEPYSLRAPVIEITRADGTPLGEEIERSPRIPPPVFGLGLLEAVPAETLEALADPDDADGDGISGRVNRVRDARTGAVAVGRFGWKAGQPSLLQQSAGAYREDMGVTSPLFPDEDGTADIDQETLDAVTFYVQTLAVPRRGPITPEVERGEALFEAIGCAACHVPELVTGDDHPVAALRGQVIHPYTDLLLHNVGFGLADGRPEFEASGTEWRTPPLWGIGLTARVAGDEAYLHDGRARTLTEAVLWHGGEAQASRDAFHEMTAADRRALIAFLESL